MSCCGADPGFDEIDEVSRLVSTRLAAFLKTLRDNGFAIGLHEGRDAASLMTAGYIEKPGLLRSRGPTALPQPRGARAASASPVRSAPTPGAPTPPVNVPGDVVPHRLRKTETYPVSVV